MSDEYGDYGDDFEDAAIDLGDDIYGEYNPDIQEETDENVSNENIFEQMFKEFNIQEHIKDVSKDELIPDDILMHINIEDEISKDDRDIDNIIDKGLETRFFQNDPNSFLNSRVGMAERIGQEQTLGTVIQGYDKLAKRQEKLNLMNLSTQQLFSINFDKACSKYNIEKNKLIGLLELVFKSDYYEYKNAFGILFGFLCIKGKNINEDLLYNIHKKYAIHENITLLDLVRYSRFIQSLL
jgi:hypothetical protein